MKQCNMNTLRYLMVTSLFCIGILASIESTTTNEELNYKCIKMKSIKSSYGSNTFVSVWNTVLDGNSESNQVKLPLSNIGHYNFEVAWGDGSNSSITIWNQAEITHTYTTGGIFTIEISGIINGWDFPANGDELKLIEITQWGCLQIGNTGGYFKGCKNLVLKASDALNLTDTTTLNEMFYDCENLGHLGNLNQWNVSHVTDMRRMFMNSKTFNQDIGSWDVSRVVDMSQMFGGSPSEEGWIYSGAENFNKPIGDWDVSCVTDMSQMFAGATSFNFYIGDWDVSFVTNMGGMFQSAKNFNQDISRWDVSNVTEMGGMFSYAKNFNQDIGGWDVSEVTSMSVMFDSASQFNQDIGRWDVSKVINMNGMFADAYHFNQPLENWDVSSVTDMMFMFANSAFDQPIGNWDISNVTNMGHMFRGAPLSTTNYDILLEGWGKRQLQQNVQFSAGEAQYSTESAKAAREHIINEFGWSISDGGFFEEKISNPFDLSIPTYPAALILILIGITSFWIKKKARMQICA